MKKLFQFKKSIAIFVCVAAALNACKHSISTDLIETFWDAEKTKIKEHYFVLKSNNKIKQNEFDAYYLNGKKEFVKHYSNDLLTDSFFHFNENGILIERSFYQNNQLEGNRILYDDNGKLMTIESHLHNNFQGKYQSFYANGNAKEIGIYDKNKMEGQWQYFYENGKLKELVNYIGGSENGYYKGFYPSGAIKSIGFYKNEKEDSLWHNYYENGKLMETVNYKNGKEEGLTQMFSKDSILIKEIVYQAGLPTEYKDYVNHVFSKHKFETTNSNSQQ